MSKEKLNVSSDGSLLEEEKFNGVEFLKACGQSIVSFIKSPTFRYIVKRIVSSIFTLFLVATVVFLLLRLVPKENYINLDKTNKMDELGKQIYVETMLEKYGLNKPVLVQLLNFWRDIIPFIPHTYCIKDGYNFNTNTYYCTEEQVKVFYLGKALFNEAGKPVTEIIATKMPISFWMSIISTLLTYMFGYPLGIFMAKNKGKLVDKLGNGYIILSLAIPSLVFYCALWLLFQKMGIGAFYSDYDKNYIVLAAPIFAMVVLSVPGTAMWARRFMVDEGDADYVKFARSKGLSENRIMFTHVFRNAVVPLVRNFPAAFVGAIIGSYYAEQVWSIPGTGRLLINALNIQKPDNVLVQGLVILYAAISMVSFLLGDIVTIFTDPRIKLTK